MGMSRAPGLRWASIAGRKAGSSFFCACCACHRDGLDERLRARECRRRRRRSGHCSGSGSGSHRPRIVRIALVILLLTELVLSVLLVLSRFRISERFLSGRTHELAVLVARLARPAGREERAEFEAREDVCFGVDDDLIEREDVVGRKE